MLILGDDQRSYLRSRARRLLSDLVISQGLQQKEECLVNSIEQAIHEACGMGYSIAMHEVQSTPWEYMSHPILTDAARNDAVMNGMASDGWELQFVNSGWHLWRRRKLVAKIAAESETE